MPFWPIEQEGVRHAAAAIGGKERAFGAGVTEQRLSVARGGAASSIVGFVRTHEAASSARRAGAVAGRSRAFTACQMCFATVFFGALGVDDDAALVARRRRASDRLGAAAREIRLSPPRSGPGSRRRAGRPRAEGRA